MKIVPSNKLILWIGLIVIPLSLLVAFIPLTAGWAVLVMSGLLVAIGGDIYVSRNVLEDIRVSLPDTIRLSRGRKEAFMLRIQNEGTKIKYIRIGLPFPPEIDSESFDLRLQVEGGGTAVSAPWQCIAYKQGCFRFATCYLETASRFGFWAMRSVLPLDTEIRVYPDLRVEQNYLAALFLNRKLGVHGQRQMGKGRDFEQLRDYLPGDSYEDIHWKATAKRRQPITKVFRIERSQKIYLIIDASRLSARTMDDATQEGPVLTTVLDRFIVAALVMGLTARRQEDLFGLLVFDQRVHTFLRAKSGKHHFNSCLDMLYTLTPRLVSPDFSELFTFIGTRIRQRALLMVLTNLDDPAIAQSFLAGVDLIRKRHLVVVNMLKPAKVAPLFSQPAIKGRDELYEHLGGHIKWQHLMKVKKRLERRGIGFILPDAHNICISLISRYLSVKQRQIL